MEIKFSGDFTVKKTPEEVYDFLVDPNRFCPLLPDYQSMEILDAKNFLVKLSVGISHIRGTAAVKMSLVEAERATRAAYEGKGDVPGGSASLRAGFDLEPLPSGETKVSWLGQSNVVGRIASLAGGLLEPLAKKNVQKLIDGLQKALG
jgi:carbon monoxide dehydrogenase subunit G